jgi:hypothetical protein
LRKEKVEPKETSCGGTDFALEKLFIRVQAQPDLCEKKRLSQKKRLVVPLAWLGDVI